MKVTLTKVNRQEKTSAQGKPYTRLGVQTVEHGSLWLSGFDSTLTRNWTDGDTVDIDVQKVVKDGKEYLNFTVPKPEDQTNKKLEQILNMLTTINLALKRIESNQPQLTSAGTKIPDFSEVDDLSDSYAEEDVPPEWNK